MIVSITGTPCTGKDTVSKLIGKMLGWKVIDLNKLAKEKNLYLGYDKKRKCDIVDIRKLNSEIKKIKKDAIIQSHYSHELTSDIVLVLRTDIGELRERLEKRGWPLEKIQENIEAEIIGICWEEALQKTKKVFRIDTSWQDPRPAVNQAIDIIFREMFEPKKNVKLPESLLEYFRKPYGAVFRTTQEFLKKINLEEEAWSLVVAVGDVASYNLIEEGVEPDIIVIDNKVNREPFDKKIKFRDKEFKVINPPGVITRDLWNTVKKAVLEAKKDLWHDIQKDGNKLKREKIKISVIGEEDLAVLPFVIMAPIGSLVLYGQPELEFKGEKIEEGLVAIKVDLEKKKDAVELFKKMMRMQ